MYTFNFLQHEDTNTDGIVDIDDEEMEQDIHAEHDQGDQLVEGETGKF